MSTELFLNFLGIRMDSRKAEGDLGILTQLASTMVDFDSRFEIMPGTHRDNAKIAKHDAFEAVPGTPIAE